MSQRYNILATADSKHRPLSVAASFWAVFLCILFGANVVAIKITLSGMGIFTTATIRWIITVVAIWLWARLTGKPIGLNQGQTHQVLILGILFFVQMYLYFLGLSMTYASRGALIVNLLPFMLLILTHFFFREDRITIRKFIGILIGFSGIAIMFFKNLETTNDFFIGDLITFSATLLWAGMSIYTKKIIDNYEAYQLVLYPALISIPLYLLGAFLFDAPMIASLNSRVILSLLYQSLVSGSFGFVAWYILFQNYGTVSLHIFVFIMPIAGVLFGGLILNEPITGRILIALCLIVMGIIITQTRTRRDRGLIKH